MTKHINRPFQISDSEQAVSFIDIKAILANPMQRRELIVTTIIAAQAREGIVTTRAQAEAAYDVIQKER
jgi:hypothetical protein